jgi:hypothetical protein
MENRKQCPCCRLFTLTELGRYELCPTCFWEDDPMQSENITHGGGANEISLLEARNNYLRFGASQKKFISSIRKPFKHEL